MTASLAADLKTDMLEHRARLSGGYDLAKAITYIFERWNALTLILEDGRVCCSNHAAERALRGMAFGRKSCLLCESDRDGQSAAAVYSLMSTCKLSEVDPQAWLADVLACIATPSEHRLDDLLPWNWKAANVHGTRQAA